MKKLFFVLALLLTIGPVAAYPTIVVTAPGSQYIATSPVNTENNYRSYQSETYDYVDGYNAGYTTAARDSFLYSRRKNSRSDYSYRGSLYAPYAPTDRTGYYNYNDVRAPGRDCNFGRSDICFNRYVNCNVGYCPVGDTDYSVYQYYNPYNVPGIYPITDANGIYYVN